MVVRFDTAHLHWPSWADAQLDPRTGKVWPGMAGAGRQRVCFQTMLVASIDTDRPAEGPPPSSACPQAVGRALSTVIAGVSTAGRLSPILPRCHSFFVFRRGAPALRGLAISADRSRPEMPASASDQKHIAARKPSSLQAPGHCGHCRVCREQRGARMDKS